QRFDLRRIPAGLIVKRLKEIAKAEKVAIDDKALAAIARGAEGGLRDAQSALDQLIAFCGDKIAEKDVLSVFGLVAHDQIAALTDALIDGETNTALKVLKELDDAGKDLQRLLADLLDHFRNLLVVTLGGEAATSLVLPDTEMDLLAKQAKRIDADAVLRLIDALSAIEGRLRYALSKKVFFEIALVKAIKARDLVGIDEVLKKLNALKARLGESEGSRTAGEVPAAAEERPKAGPAPAPTSVEKPKAGPAPSPAAVEEAWDYAAECLGKVTPIAKSYLVGTRPLGLRDNVLTIGFDPEFAERREFVDTARNREVLQAKLKEKLRIDVSLKFEIAPDTLSGVP
ncbi:MAG: DNA polymerase III subunit gamma/tau, partial [Gammaproteobacteria bacterium]